MSNEGRILKLLDNEVKQKVLTASQKKKRNRKNKLWLKKKKLKEAEKNLEISAPQKNLSEYQKKRNKSRTKAYQMRQAKAKKNQASIQVANGPLQEPSVEVIKVIPVLPFQASILVANIPLQEPSVEVIKVVPVLPSQASIQVANIPLQEPSIEVNNVIPVLPFQASNQVAKIPFQEPSVELIKVNPVLPLPAESENQENIDINIAKENPSKKRTLDIFKSTKNKTSSKKQKVFHDEIEDIYKKSWSKPSQTCSCQSSETSQPPPYHQFGYASHKSILERNFKKKYGESVSLHEMFYCENETAYSCNPSGHTFKPEPDVKVSVFYTRHPSACIKHRYMVITLIVWSALEEKTLKRMDHYLRSNFLQERKENKGTRGNFSACTSCSKKNCGRKGEKQHPPCTCNLFPASAWSYGCAKKINADICKWNVEATQSEGRQRFSLDGKEDNLAFKNFCYKAADNLSAIAMKYVPQAVANNFKYLEPAIDCQLGGIEAPRCFAGISINSDYCAHSHVDRNDYQFGTNAILSFRSEKAHPKEQLHCLPHYKLKSDGRTPGVKFLLTNGSVCFENSSLEVHSSTKALQPNPQNPKRIALVVYLHKCLNQKAHGQFYKSQV